MKVTNNSGAPRGFNVMVNKQPQMVLLQPGETMEDVTLVNPKDEAFLGMVKTRDLLVEDAPAVQKSAEKVADVPTEPAKPAGDTREAVDPNAPKADPNNQKSNTRS